MLTHGNSNGWRKLALHYFIKVIVESTENRLLINNNKNFPLHPPLFLFPPIQLRTFSNWKLQESCSPPSSFSSFFCGTETGFITHNDDTYFTLSRNLYLLPWNYMINTFANSGFLIILPINSRNIQPYYFSKFCLIFYTGSCVLYYQNL